MMVANIASGNNLALQKNLQSFWFKKYLVAIYIAEYIIEAMKSTTGMDAPISRKQFFGPKFSFE